MFYLLCRGEIFDWEGCWRVFDWHPSRGSVGCVVWHLVDGVVAAAMVVAFIWVTGGAEAFVGLSVFSCPQEAVAAVVSPFVGVGGEKVELTP